MVWDLWAVLCRCLRRAPHHIEILESASCLVPSVRPRMWYSGLCITLATTRCTQTLLVPGLVLPAKYIPVHLQQPPSQMRCRTFRRTYVQQLLRNCACILRYPFPLFCFSSPFITYQKPAVCLQDSNILFLGSRIIILTSHRAHCKAQEI